MTHMKLAFLTAAAIGAMSIGGASAMPFNNLAAPLIESQAQDVRLVCNQYGRCYNTRRAYRYGYVRRSYPSYYYSSPGYYAAPSYGYYGGPRIGIGPFGFGVW